MNFALWMIASALGLAFVAGGLLKLTQPRSKLISSGQRWAEDFSDTAVKSIGALEIVGGLGLVLPALFDVMPVLVPFAAVGIVLLLVGAATVHARRGEQRNIVVIFCLACLSGFVAAARFGPYGF